MKLLNSNILKKVAGGIISAIPMLILLFFAQPFAVILIWLFIFPMIVSIISGLIRGFVFNRWETLIFSFRIFKGNFIIEDDKGFYQGIFAIVRRIVWEQPQTLLGNFAMHVLNTVWLLKKVDVWKHTLICQGVFLNGGGIALGSFIMIDLQNARPIEITAMDERTVPEKILIRHEYGHALQSIDSGPLFIFKYGIPSIIMQGWTETDADFRSDKKLLSEDKIMPFFSAYRTQKHHFNPAWWEFAMIPIFIIAGWMLNEVNGLAVGILFSMVLISLINIKKPA